MVTRVYLMRHGEVANGGEKRYNGHIDVDITPRGVEQMHALAEKLAGTPVAAVYSSDLIRSVKGAEIISQKLGVSFTPLRSLRERSVGRWEGLTAEEIKARFPEEYTAWRADLLNYRPPGGGECVLDVRDRIMPEYRKLVAAHPGQEIAMLLHGGVNRVIFADVLGLPLTNLFRVDQAFGALNIIDHYDDGMAVVKLLNG
jgi:broad specificity phosphatase PhoE